MKTSAIILTNSVPLQLNINDTLLALDPLEQFDVLAISVPLIGSFGLTNLALLLGLNIVIMAS